MDKESLPVELADYVRENGIIEESAFSWLDNCVLRKRDRIIKVTKKYWKKTYKYVIRLPKTLKEALAIDRETDSTFWRDALDKAMRNVRIGFEFNDKDEVGHKEITLHMVFDVRITLERKCRLVADGHKAQKEPKEYTFASVVEGLSSYLLHTGCVE